MITVEHQVVMLGLSPKEAELDESISEDGVRWKISGVELMRRWKRATSSGAVQFLFLT